MKLDDLRKEAISGIDPYHKWDKRPLLTKKGILASSPDFDYSFILQRCECGSVIGVKLGSSICPVCGKDQNSIISSKVVFDMSKIRVLDDSMRKIGAKMARIRELAKAVRTTYDFHKVVENASLGLPPKHFNSRCDRYYPLFDPTDARIADLQKYAYPHRIILPDESKRKL
jgi:hypothetical protein